MFVVFVSTCVTVNSHILFFCRHFKNPVRKHSEFSVQDRLCDPARLLTNQIACFTVVII